MKFAFVIWFAPNPQLEQRYVGRSQSRSDPERDPPDLREWRLFDRPVRADWHGALRDNERYGQWRAGAFMLRAGLMELHG